MSLWRFFAYLVGISAFIFSKVLVVLAFEIVLLIWNLPDQLVTYWTSKGPVFLTATILILFGVDHMLFPRGALASAGRRSNLRSVRVVGVVVMGAGIYLFYEALLGGAAAW